MHCMQITHASDADLDDVRSLFIGYATFLNLDLSFQNFENELASLPGKFCISAGGGLLIAKGKDGTVGCVAVRKLFETSCEMKRLYVSPKGRGQGLGKALVREIIQLSRTLGYEKMYLDTLPTLSNAVKLYEKEGFNRVGPYYETSLKDTLFFMKEL